MMRLPTLSIALVICIVAPMRVLAQAPVSNRPNIVFILADDWGWGDLSCYGLQRIHTPNLDRLASQGTLFTQFYVCSGVCSPSRTAFMTGQFPARHAIHGHLATPELNARRGMPNFLDPEVPTVTRLLREAGYKTAHFGKWHLGSGDDAPGVPEYGIDDYRVVNGPGKTWDNADDPYFRAKSSELIIDETIRFIEENRDGPFYVQAWYLLTHATLHPTDEQLKPFARFSPRGVPYAGAAQVYYASLANGDRQIGRLMDKIDELGLADNTIVVFSSDNGPEDIYISNASHSGIGSSGPFRGRKRSLYEGGVRVPFIVRWPRATPAGRIDNESVVCAADWLPTLCALTGIGLPDGYNPDGKDVSAAIRGQAVRRTKPIMWEWRFRIFNHVWNRSPMLSIRDGDYKLLLNPDRSRVELYDIPNDPSEQNNVADRHPDVVERLARTVLSWQKELPPGPVDPQAGKNDYPWPKR